MSGVAFIDNDGGANWFGVTMEGEFVMGPNIITITNTTMAAVFASNASLYSQPGSTVPPYFNESCSFVISSVSQIFEQQTGYWITLVTCPQVRYFAFYYDNRFGNYEPFIKVDGSISQYLFITGKIYPDYRQVSTIKFYLDMIYTPFSQPRSSRDVQSFKTAIPAKSFRGSSLVTFSFTGTSVQFQNQVLKPKLTSVSQSPDMQTLDIKAYVYSGKGSCLLTTDPQVTTDERIDLTTMEQAFSSPLSKVQFTGNVTVLLTCGRYSDTKSLEIKLIASNPLTTTEKFMITQWSGVPWYINLPKVAIMVGILIAILFVAWKVYCMCFRRSIKYMRPKLKSM
jgi:hypothetical protein